MTELEIKPSRRTLMAAVAALAATVGTGAMAQTTDPVRALLDAMARKDSAAIRAQFAVDATQAYGTGAWKTPEAFKRWLETDIIAAEGVVTDAKFVAEGQTVVVTGRYRNKSGYSSAANFLFEVSSGKITRWRMRY